MDRLITTSSGVRVNPALERFINALDCDFLTGMKRQKILEEPNLKAALYTRVSTEDQAKEGYSLEVQREYLEDFAKRERCEDFL